MKVIDDNHDKTVNSRMTSGTGLAVVGTLCCAGPLKLSGIVNLPLIGVISGLRVVVAAGVKLIKNH